MVQTINLSEETYELLTKEKAKLMLETGSNQTYDDTIKSLIKRK